MSRFRRPCLGIGGARCPHLTRNPGGRCDTCRREWERLRGSSTQRGYGREHRALRAYWAPIVATGTVTCRRPGCGQLIAPHELWDLGHSDNRTDSAPEHADCNRGHRPRPGGPISPTPPAHQPIPDDTEVSCPF